MKNIKFDFDDILIVPTVTTEISSRYKDIILPEQLPLFTAPMDTVVDLNNAHEFTEKGITVCLPRTIKHNNLDHFPTYKMKGDPSETLIYEKFENMFFSFGLNELEQTLKEGSKNFYLFDNILIDVANGHMERILDVCKKIRKIKPTIKIMVGNIGNPKAYTWYAESDLVDYIRVGIGNGCGCLTTKQSGVGYPMASLIHETYLEKQKFLLDMLFNNYVIKRVPAIVADGGMKDYADIVKSFALGADYVMLGSIFNKALESCAQNYKNGKEIDIKTAEKLFKKGITITKHFRGMSTKGAQKAMGKTDIKTSEGVVRYHNVEYTLDNWIENFEHYLRNAMSYVNAKTLEEFKGKVEICQITKNAYDRFNK